MVRAIKQSYALGSNLPHPIAIKSRARAHDCAEFYISATESLQSRAHSTHTRRAWAPFASGSSGPLPNMRLEKGFRHTQTHKHTHTISSAFRRVHARRTHENSADERSTRLARLRAIAADATIACRQQCRRSSSNSFISHIQSIFNKEMCAGARALDTRVRPSRLSARV